MRPLQRLAGARPAAWRGPGARRGSPLYYGWVLVAVLGITETVSWGILYYAFAVFLAPMEAELGWSRAAMTGAFSLAVLLSGVAAVPVGRWLDRHGPRWLMTTGSCAGVLLLLAWSAVHDLVGFYALWAGIGITMAAVLYEPALAVLAVWFRRRRAQALTALTLMAGLASTIFLPLAAWLVQLQGWRPALVTLAIILAAVTVPLHAVFLRRRPQDLGLHPDGLPPQGSAEGSAQGRGEGMAGHAPPAGAGASLTAALRHPTFPWLVLAFSLYAVPAIGLQVHLVPYLAERGIEPSLAAAAAGLVGAMQLVGRALFAPLERRLAPRALSAGIFGLQAIALLTLLLVPATAGVIAFVVLFGAGRGAATLARPLIVAGLYGPARYASIAGVVAFFVTAAQAAAPVSLGLAYDAAGGYTPVLWGSALISLAAAAAVFVADRRGAD
ncbi:MAG TPA: MFS transporter [Chloroflexota bacterium]|nr:MFS transporter [Chloroflexota bacterium]